MDFLNDLAFEKEKERLLTTYNCKDLDEVILFLKKKIREANLKKEEKVHSI